MYTTAQSSQLIIVIIIIIILIVLLSVDSLRKCSKGCVLLSSLSKRLWTSVNCPESFLVPLDVLHVLEGVGEREADSVREDESDETTKDSDPSEYAERHYLRQSAELGQIFTLIIN